MRSLTGRFVRSQRGMEALQVVLILGVAFTVLLGLRQMYFSIVVPGLTDQAGVLLRPNGLKTARVESKSLPTTTAKDAMTAKSAEVAPDPADARSLSVQSQPRRVGDRPLAADAAPRSALALGTLPANPRVRELLTRIAERYQVRRIEVGGAGVEVVVLVPKDPTDKQAIVAVGGAGEWDDLTADSTETRPGPTGPDAANPYAVALGLVRELAKQYGADNVTVIGHSTGGAIATYVGGIAGLKATAYSAAPLPPEVLDELRRSAVRGAEENITQVRVAGEAAPPAANEVGAVLTVRAPAGDPAALALGHVLDEFAPEDVVSSVAPRPLAK